jgi:hypothetical protein
MNQFTLEDFRELCSKDRDVAFEIRKILLWERDREICEKKAKVMRLLPCHVWGWYCEHGKSNDNYACRLDEGDYVCEDEGVIFVKWDCDYVYEDEGVMFVKWERRMRRMTYLEVARGN